MSQTINCPRCASPVPPELFNAPREDACPACATPLRVRAYPALWRELPQGSSGERITVEGQAACFYHPNKTAHVPCDSCGRFVCALCDVELHGQHLCPSCIESGRRKGSLTTLENKRVLWDNIALTAAVGPMLMWPLTFVTAPAAIILALYGWRKPRSLVPRRARLNFIAAIVIASLIIAGWAVGIYFLIKRGME
jgi:hypothetical protein